MAGKRIVIPNYMPALDLNGNPLAGAKITFYENETTTLKSIYTSAALTVQHPNPVIANASGVFPSIFADEVEEFSVAITDADDAPIGGLRNRDNIRPSLAFLDGVDAPVSDVMATVLEQETLADARTELGAASTTDVVGKLDNDLVSLAAIKAKAGSTGDVLVSPLYGSPWELRTAATVQNTTLAADDEIHRITAASGTWAAQIGPLIGTLRKKAADNKARACSKLAIISSLPTDFIINVLGDSITYGQVAPALVGGDRIATGYGDGSLHEWTQAALPWPQDMHDRLELLYGPKITVNARGYSGDRVENAFARHLTAPTSDITIVSYMVNDVLFATTNGGSDGLSQLGLLQATGVGTANESGNYCVQFYTDALFRLLAREILRGAWPFVAIEAPFQGGTGYDGTGFAAGRLLQQMATAARSVADALGLPVIDFADRVAAYAIPDMTTDGVHPSTLGHQVRASLAAATIAGEAQSRRVSIAGETYVSVNVGLDPVIGYRAGSVMVNVTNSSSFGRPFLTATDAADIFTSAGQVTSIAVYLEVDEVEIYPLGFMSNGGSGTVSIDQLVDFGVTQPPPKLDIREEAGLPGNEAVPATKTINVSTSTAKHFNHPAVFADLLRIQGRGWHIFSLSSPAIGGGTFILSGFAAGNFGKWRGLTLESGFTQLGDIQPAVRMENGLKHTRGIILAATPLTADQTVATVTGYSRVTFYDTASNITVPWTLVEMGWTGMDLIWKSSPGSNIYNLGAMPPRPALILDDA